MFGHFLIGGATGDAGPNFSGFSDSGLALGGGGGVDVLVNRRLAIRPPVRSAGQLRRYRRGQLQVRDWSGLPSRRALIVDFVLL